MDIWICITLQVREANIKDKVAAFIKANRTVYMSVLKFEVCALLCCVELLEVAIAYATLLHQYNL